MSAVKIIALLSITLFDRRIDDTEDQKSPQAHQNPDPGDLVWETAELRKSLALSRSSHHWSVEGS